MNDVRECDAKKAEILFFTSHSPHKATLGPLTAVQEHFFHNVNGHLTRTYGVPLNNFTNHFRRVKNCIYWQPRNSKNVETKQMHIAQLHHYFWCVKCDINSMRILFKIRWLPLSAENLVKRNNWILDKISSITQIENRLISFWAVFRTRFETPNTLVIMKTYG